MKKTFNLEVPNKKRERQVDSIKHEVRKYITREKKKALPEGFDYWNFICKFALEDEEIQDIDFTDITKSIDKAYESGKDTFYLEILKEAAKRKSKED
ncbi:MAG: hypothetical protein KGV43_02615 [Arcobacter sp.]|nr:hypothetical protein [Arcobacter sp.]